MRDMELEVFEGDNCTKHKVGQTFKYPGDNGKLCPWLFYSASHMIQVLMHDGRLGWSYKNTLYEKIINKDGIATEFVGCPDPTSSGIVLKITATKHTRK